MYKMKEMNLYSTLMNVSYGYVRIHIPAMMGWRLAPSSVMNAREEPFWLSVKAFAQDNAESRAMESFIVDWTRVASYD